MEQGGMIKFGFQGEEVVDRLLADCTRKVSDAEADAVREAMNTQHPGQTYAEVEACRQTVLQESGYPIVVVDPKLAPASLRFFRNCGYINNGEISDGDAEGLIFAHPEGDADMILLVLSWDLP